MHRQVVAPGRVPGSAGPSAALPAEMAQAMPSPQPRTSIVFAAWAVILALSLMPTVIAQEVLGQAVSPDLRAGSSVVVLVTGLALTLLWTPLRELRPFLSLFLVLVGAQWVVFTQVDRLPLIDGWLRDPSFGVYMPAEQGLNLIVTLAVIVLLLLVKRDRRAFYLVKGDTSATAQPIPWLGVKRSDRWSTLGPTLAVCITLGTLAFLVISGRPSTDLVIRALPLLPVVLLAAALNAFNEEVTYKASFLSVLVEPVGSRNAVWMVAAYFGIAHFYGVPYGIVGVVLAWFLGWILAMSMLETRCLWWAWLIHFVQDVAIFGFMAIGAITPGGG